MNANQYQTIRVLCSSMTPTTLAAIIADLDANDQLTPDDQVEANAIREGAANQLECMVGQAEAQRLVNRA